MADPKNIDEVILAIQAERPVLTKDKKGQVGNQKTKYADLVQVNDVVLKRLNEMSTIWKCRPHLDAPGSFGLRYSLKHVPSGTEEAGVWPLKLSENPQQMGSAVTYGRRYALLAVLGIVADDEDDDGNAASGRRYAQRATPQRDEPAEQGRPQAQRGAQRARPAGQPPLPGEEAGRTAAQMGTMHALFGKVGIADRAVRLAVCSTIAGRQLATSNELTKRDASKVIDLLMQVVDDPVPLDRLAANLGVSVEDLMPDGGEEAGDA